MLACSPSIGNADRSKAAIEGHQAHKRLRVINALHCLMHPSINKLKIANVRRIIDVCEQTKQSVICFAAEAQHRAFLALCADAVYDFISTFPQPNHLWN